MEDWADEVLLFDTKEELQAYFYESYRDKVTPYKDMSDSKIEEVYDLANEEEWNSVPVFSSDDDS